MAKSKPGLMSHFFPISAHCGPWPRHDHAASRGMNSTENRVPPTVGFGLKWGKKIPLVGRKFGGILSIFETNVGYHPREMWDFRAFSSWKWDFCGKS